ncbi:hypothetical protein ABIB86_000443 [Bradyrhizobium sp. JR1.7]|uniref:hypothetical protein n=1 Tax=unclassified Bradyrhizobium TaxID=2631580 RepID=UPI003398D5ED
MRTLDVPQLVRAEVQQRDADRQMQTRLMYVPPLDGSLDPHRNFDAFVAGRIMEILNHHFPGYPWHAVSNAQQGIVYFSIPVLMGETLRYLIKLGDWSDLSPKLVIDGGGELLERMNLPRKGFDVMSFIKARDQKHLSDFADAGKARR